MNCSACEQLFDAYLDGQLVGSLRLEFDAHRLRCRRCQQTLAMLETVVHVISTDTQTPELSSDFTARVMRQVRRARPRFLKIPSTRVAIVVGAALQAAAVLALAILWQRPAAPPVPAEPSPALTAADLDRRVETDPGYRAIRELIVDGVEDRLWKMHAARSRLTQDVLALAGYLNIPLPDEVMRESSKLVGVNPWQAVWDTLAPEAEPSPEPAAAAETVLSI